MRLWAGLLALISCTAVDAQERGGWKADVEVLHDDLMKNHPGFHERTTPRELGAKRDSLIGKIPQLSWPAYVAGLGQMIATLDDGHSNIFPPQVPGPGFDKGYPVKLFFFDDGLYATHVGKGLEHLAGKRILEINGHSPADLVAKMRTAIGHDNMMWALELVPLGIATPGLLNGVGLSQSVGTSLQLNVDAGNGRKEIIAVEARPWSEAAPDALNSVLDLLQPTQAKGSPYDNGPNIEMRRLAEGKALLVTYRSVSNDGTKIADFAHKLEQELTDPTIERLIFDVRANSGGNNTLNQPLIHAVIRSARINQPGRLFAITGRKTYSAAMNFVTALERETQILFVGEPTGGSPNHFGDAELITLPNSKISYYRSTLRWQDSRPKDRRHWIRPDIVVAPKFADLRAGKDPALEAALGYQSPLNERVYPPVFRWQRASQSQPYEPAIR